MIYATQADIEARLAPDVRRELTDDDNDETPDPAAIDAALADASAEIDRRLSGRYVTPVEPASPVLKMWCADLAIERLFLRRGQSLTTSQADRATLARRALGFIADGLTGLAGAQPRPQDFESDNTRRTLEATFSDATLAPY